MNNYSNEKLAELINNGHSEYAYLLWQKIEKLIFKRINTVVLKHSSIMQSKGIEYNDLIQECYFAFVNALNAFDGAAGYKFTTYLEYHIKNTVNELLGFRTAAGRNDLLSNSISIDATLNDADNLTIADTIIDENATAGFTSVEDMIYIKQLHNDLENAISRKLNVYQEYCIIEKYFNNCTTKQLAEECNSDMVHIQNMLKTALLKLSKDNTLKKYQDDIISSHAYKATGLNAFKNNGASSVERTVERLY